MKCPSCEKTIPDNVSVCPYCASPVKDPIEEIDIIEADPLFHQRWQKWDTFAILGLAIPALTGCLAGAAGAFFSILGLHSKKATWAAIVGLALSVLGSVAWLIYFLLRYLPQH